MYAVFTEVDADDSDASAGRQLLPELAAPAARSLGAKAGYWLAPKNGRGVAVIVFETEGEAQSAAQMFEVGKPPMPNAPANVIVRTVEVREVLAAV
jgi:hypothetical protein